LILAPTGSGKTQEAKLLGAHDREKGSKVLVVVPQLLIASGFEKAHEVLPIEGLTWGSDTWTKDATRERLDGFLRRPPTPDINGRIFVTTHGGLINQFKSSRDMNFLEMWDGVSLFVDEIHHAQIGQCNNELDNGLGQVLRHFIGNPNSKLTIMTATWLRSDGQILGDLREQFNQYTYHLDEYLQDTFAELTIRFRFIVGGEYSTLEGGHALDGFQCFRSLVEECPQRETLVYIPPTRSRVIPPIGENSEGQSIRNKDRFLECSKLALGEWSSGDHYDEHHGLGIKSCDLVDNSDCKQVERQGYLLESIRDNCDAPNLIFAMRRCIEGFDWPRASRAILMNPRTSIREVLQILGRLLRKVPGQPRKEVEFNIIIPVDIEHNPSPDVLADFIKVMDASMVFGWQFRQISLVRRNSNENNEQASEPSESDLLLRDLLEDTEPLAESVTDLIQMAIASGTSTPSPEQIEQALDELLEDRPELNTPAVREPLRDLFSRSILRQASEVPFSPDIQREDGIINSMTVLLRVSDIRELRDRMALVPTRPTYAQLQEGCVRLGIRTRNEYLLRYQEIPGAPERVDLTYPNEWRADSRSWGRFLQTSRAPRRR
jgi:hypothetical protein